MGNRAYVVFEKGANRSPAVYLHWHGGPESVYAFLQALHEYGADRHSPEYSCARFVQLAGNYLGGTLSLGIVPFTRIEQLFDDDNGLYLVTPDKVRRMCWKPIEPDDDVQEPVSPSWDVYWLTEEEVAAEYQTAMQHPTWKPEPGRESLLEALRRINDRFFLETAGAPA